MALGDIIGIMGTSISHDASQAGMKMFRANIALSDGWYWVPGMINPSGMGTKGANRTLAEELRLRQL